MENEVKREFLNNVETRFGKLESFGGSRSLFRITGSDIRLYIRYSKTHNNNKAFYGLRAKDLTQIEGFPSFICFLWQGQEEPIIIPYSEYEEVFHAATLADDGNIKRFFFFKMMYLNFILLEQDVLMLKVT